MTRFLLLTMFSLTLSVSGCDGARPVDAPLLSFAELEAAFPPQPPGRGIVREGENYRSGGFTVEATHRTAGVAAVRFTVFLANASQNLRLSFRLFDTEFSDLSVGDTFEGVSVGYNPPGGSSEGLDGWGRFKVTAIEGTRLSGVFAADVSADGFVPLEVRVTGRFTATLAAER